MEKGFTYNKYTGYITSTKGKIIKSKLKTDYIYIQSKKVNEKSIQLCGHIFGYYFINKKCVEFIDHKNGIRYDNRLDNLREVTKQENAFNTKAKGYYWYPRYNKWCSTIKIDGKTINLGYFEKEEEASEAYKEAKLKYHIIKNNN